MTSRRLIALAVAAGTLAGCGSSRDHGSRAAEPSVPPDTSVEVEVAPPVPGAIADEAETSTEPTPERVLFLGDSLIWSQREELTAELDELGADVRFEGGNGTGLLTGQERWHDDLVEAIDEFAPDTVVIEACCNYGATKREPEGGYYRLDGSVVQPDTEEMYDLWSAAAERLVDVAVESGARVWWVITPPVAPLVTVHQRVERFNRITRRLAADRTDLRLMDWAAALTSPSGDFVRTVRLPDGTRANVRKDDGVHFTEAGDAVLTSATVDALLSDDRPVETQAP